MDLSKPMRSGAALAHGIARRELAGEDWNHPYRGVVRLGSGDPQEAGNRISEAIPLLTSGAVLTGWASAHRQGVRMLDGIDRAGRLQPIVICCPSGGRLRPRDGISPSRRSIHLNEYSIVEGVSMTSLARAAYDMALDAPSACEALVAFDMCISTVIRQSRTTLSAIENVLSMHRKTRGISQARHALALAESRSASPWETRTRYEARIGADIRNLLVNAPVFDRAGRLVGVADLLCERTGLVIESDGAGHRQEIPHAEDNVREEALERLGFVVSRVSAVDHRQPLELRSRLRNAQLHANTLVRERKWSLEKPDWWWGWEPGRRWD
ncbi:MAG: DUF559 domain-containing protein [Aeromicrobium sp.]